MLPFQLQYRKKLQELIKNEKKKQIIRSISTRLQPIDSSRFMTSSLSNLVNNLAEEIQKYKCKYRHDMQNFRN